LAKEAHYLMAQEAAQGFKPAALLPAPPTPRFVSSAEQAAERLPEAVKAESVANALVRGGAKPAELKYADLDGFLAARKGQKVSAADVLDHIKKEGPLGKLMRVDQRAPTEAEVRAAGTPDPSDVDGLYEPTNEWQRKKAGLPPRADVREPFSDELAYPLTQYHKYTEQGRRGDHSGYREVLFSDPRTTDIRKTMSRLPSRHMIPDSGNTPVDAHRSDYWVRYHSNPGEIAVQNVQSDIGQLFSRREAYLKQFASDRGLALNKADDYDALHDALLSHAEDLERRTQNAPPEDPVHLDERKSTFALKHLEATRGNFGDSISPLVEDDRWKDFLARHVVLQAAAEGKPITLPSAENANMAEMMPVAAARHFYEQDMPSRIRKILKEFDQSGGAVVSQHGSNTPHFQSMELMVPDGSMRATDSGWEYVNTRPPPMYGHTPEDAGVLADVLLKNRSVLPADYQYVFDDIVKAKSQNQTPTVEPAINAVLSHAGDSPEAGSLAGMLLGYAERLPDWGSAFHVMEDAHRAAAGRPRPGTHIRMTPVARRNILERGMPIMSVLPAAALGASQPGILSGLTEER
jgi:hypothetical protein